MATSTLAVPLRPEKLQPQTRQATRPARRCHAKLAVWPLSCGRNSGVSPCLARAGATLTCAASKLPRRGFAAPTEISANDLSAKSGQHHEHQSDQGGSSDENRRTTSSLHSASVVNGARVLLIDIKQRGLDIAPDLGSLMVRSASGRRSRRPFQHQHRRCWVHKTGNLLNKVALSVEVNMKADFVKFTAAPTRAGSAAIDSLLRWAKIAELSLWLSESAFSNA